MPNHKIQHRFENGQELKHCTCCHEWKSVESYAKCNTAKGPSDCLQSRCKQCKNSGKPRKQPRPHEWVDGVECKWCSKCLGLFPLSKGGLHLAKNIKPCCRLCNSKKHNNVHYQHKEHLNG